MLEPKLDIANLSYEEFCDHFFNKKHHVPKVELICKLKDRIHQFEEKYGMTTEEFIPRYVVVQVSQPVVVVQVS